MIRGLILFRQRNKVSTRFIVNTHKQIENNMETNMETNTLRESVQAVQNLLRDIRDADQMYDAEWYAIIDAIEDLTCIKPQ